MLASDVANADFVNPVRNPDDLLHVEFYWFAPVDKWESDKAGKQVFLPKQPFVRYGLAGDRLNIQEVPVQEWHKQRWPQRWMAWQMKEGLIDGAGDIPGWKIDEWPELNEAQRHELKYLRFATVEQIAGANDSQVQKMGMGGLALREKAKIALRNKMGAEVKAELEAKDKVIAEQETRLARLEALMLGQQSSNGLAGIGGSASPSVVQYQSEIKQPDERVALADKYQAKFGRKPHHKLSLEKLRQAVG